MYKCICGVFVLEKLKLCRECARKHGSDYRTWSKAISLQYNDINFGQNHEDALLYEKQASLGTAKARSREKTAPDVVPIKTGPRNCPVCQAPVKVSHNLCDKCLAKYGSDRSKWDTWLQVLVTDDQRIVDNARNHRELSINDELHNKRGEMMIPGEAGYKSAGSYGGKVRAKINRAELSHDDISWNDVDTETETPVSAVPGPIKGDKLGLKYNATAWQNNQDEYEQIAGFGERDQVEDRIAVIQELNELDPYAAKVFTYYYEQGYRQKEIGKMLYIGQQRVSEILQKIREKHPEY